MNTETEIDIDADTMTKANEIYDRLIRPALESENKGRLVAIDVDSQEFEIGDRLLAISDKLRNRYPNARIGVIRIGVGPVYRFGLRGRPQ